VRTYSRNSQSSTATPAKPGDLPFGLADGEISGARVAPRPMGWRPSLPDTPITRHPRTSRPPLKAEVLFVRFAQAGFVLSKAFSGAPISTEKHRGAALFTLAPGAIASLTIRPLLLNRAPTARQPSARPPTDSESATMLRSVQASSTPSAKTSHVATKRLQPSTDTVLWK
jgi:hypothetical protein